MPNCYYYDEQRNHCKCYVNENLNELLAENAKLREERREYKATIDSLVDECADHKAENAKLRELVRHLYEYRQLYFKTGIYPTDHGVTERRMRELGIEVES